MDSGTNDAGTDDVVVEWPFEPSQVWAAEDEELPPGATMVTPEEFLALSRIEGFRLKNKAEEDAKAAEQAAQIAADEALVMAELGDHPNIDLWLPPLTDPAPDGLTKLGDGAYLIHLEGPGGEDVTVRSNSRADVVQAIAWSLRETNARDNLGRRFASLVGRLPDDARAELPPVEALDDLTDEELADEVALVERRLEETTPNQILPQGAYDGSFANPTGCVDEIRSYGDDLDWQLAPYETPVRWQGARGTCTAFAVTAGLETMVHRRHGVPVDLSEQELYSEARDNWLIDPADFHDGIMAGTMLHNMMLDVFRVDAEHHWPYNPSEDREQDGLLLTWRKSCLNYDYACSNTNHQRGTVCSPAPPPYFGTYCATHQPEPGTVGGNIGNVRLKDSVSLWNGLEPQNSLASIRAHIQAGHPVVVGVWLDNAFRLAAADSEDQEPWSGWVSAKNTWMVEPAPHSMLVVGYIYDSQLPVDVGNWEDDTRDFYEGFGGGYFVLKNSWGCVGDKGHFFVSFDWLADQIYEAQAITDIGTPIVQPQVDIVAAKSLVTTAGPVRFTATLNRAVVRWELYDSLGEIVDEERVMPEPLHTADVPAPADGVQMTFDHAIDASDNGLVSFVAWGYDTFGNHVASNIVAVLVKIDTGPPSITLQALDPVIAAPGTVRLRAYASDDLGVARVRFYRGLQLIGEDATRPYALDFGVGASQLGTSAYFAMAEDVVGKTQFSAIVEVDVVAPGFPPIIVDFTATPEEIPYGGGSVKLAFGVLGATEVTLSPNIGVVGTVGARWVILTQDTLFTLTAKNVHGTTTRDVLVTIGALEAPRITHLSAQPATLPATGGITKLVWEVVGDELEGVSFDQGLGDVRDLSDKEVEIRETTLFTLTAKNPAGIDVESVLVTVLPDTTPPVVSLEAGAPSVIAPATARFIATASDDLAVIKVELAKDGIVVATDTDPNDGWELEADFGLADIGDREMTAIAHDAAGNSTISDRVLFHVAPPPPPVVTSFTATPADLPVGGGETTLTWTVTGLVDTLTIDHGVGDVTGLAMKTITLGATTKLTLTATNAGGQTEATVEVTVAPDTEAPEVVLEASADEVFYPAVVTLGATATDDVGVTEVQLTMDDALVGVDTDGEDKWLFDVALTAADLGERSFVATAFDAAGNWKRSEPVVVLVKGEPPPDPPVIASFTATPAALPPIGGSSTLAWSVTGVVDRLTIDHGVGDVLGQTDADVTVAATTVYTLTAANAGGEVTAEVTVTVTPDTTPPTVSLAASATDVVAPTTIELTATASDDVAVDHVDLYMDGALVDDDGDGTDGWSFLVALEVADVGAHDFEAVAWDLAGNEATSNLVTVTVAAPDLRTFVSPTGGDTGNADCAQATPCRTIAKAAQVAAGQRAVVLLDGTYDTTTQGSTAIVLPAGTMIEAANDGAVNLKVVLSFNGGSVRGVVVDRTAPNAASGTQIRVTGGTVHIESVSFRGSFSGPDISEGIEVTGASVVTMAPGSVSDYTAETVALANVANPTPFIRVEDTAQMTVKGGAFGGPGLGAVPSSSPNNGNGAALLVREQGKLVMEDVTLSYRATAAGVLHDGELHLTRTSFVANTAGSGHTAAVHLQGGTGELPRLFMTSSTLDGLDLAAIHGIHVYSSTVAEVTLIDSVVEDHTLGVFVGPLGDGKLTLTMTDSEIRSNAYSGIKCDGACTLDLQGGALADNGKGPTSASPFGALWLGGTSPTHHLTMRGVSVTGNKHPTVNTITNRNDNSAVVLKGSATSTFDLGTALDPGGNSFVDNITGASTSNLWVAVASGVVVSAAGNTWTALVQGADASGHYTLGASPCGETSCELTAGDGDNYMVTGGALRLAE
ncbi:MAG: hypothetical protein IT385_09555 [Deltaproteobacteria bacterium]|nr:hypothetical protein [Deltaproteobacteria bacterium]